MEKRSLDAETITRLRRHVIILYEDAKQLWTIEVASSQTRLQMRRSASNTWTVVYSDLYPHAPLFEPLKELLIETAKAELLAKSAVH